MLSIIGGATVLATDEHYTSADHHREVTTVNNVNRTRSSMLARLILTRPKHFMELLIKGAVLVLWDRKLLLQTCCHMCEGGTELIFIWQHRESTLKLFPDSKSVWFDISPPRKTNACTQAAKGNQRSNVIVWHSWLASHSFCSGASCSVCLLLSFFHPSLLPILPFSSSIIFPATVACWGVRLQVSTTHL